MKALSFKVNDDLFLLDISQVNSIVEQKTENIRSLPESPAFFVGLAQLREKTISVLCASLMFSNTPLASQETHTVIIMKSKTEELYGLIVSKVFGVKEIEEASFTSNDMIEKLNPYVMRVLNDGDKLHLLIDADKLIDIKNVQEVHYEKNNKH